MLPRHYQLPCCFYDFDQSPVKLHHIFIFFLLQGTPPQTAILALRRASAARVIPFEEIGHEIATMVGEPRTAYPGETPLADHLIPPSHPNSTGEGRLYS